MACLNWPITVAAAVERYGPYSRQFITTQFALINILQLGPKAEDISKPINPFVFLSRLIPGALAATYYMLVPIYM